MDGVRIDFTGNAPTLDFSAKVAGFDADVQNAMVNLGTDIGSDALLPSRGTYLLRDAVQGSMVNLQWANNMANFAAMRTLVFSQQYDSPNNTTGLQTLSLAAGVFDVNRLQFQIYATSSNGETRGVQANL